jgi:hypothetical protein
MCDSKAFTPPCEGYGGDWKFWAGFYLGASVVGIAWATWSWL